MGPTGKGRSREDQGYGFDRDSFIKSDLNQMEERMGQK